MKKVFSTILVVAILLSMTISAYATEVSDHSLEEMSVPEAMSNAEIVNFLISTGEIDDCPPPTGRNAGHTVSRR